MSAVRIGGRALGLGAAAASGSAVHARAPAPAVTNPPPAAPAKAISDDEWLLTDHDVMGDVVLFRQFSAAEIDSATEEMQSLLGGDYHTRMDSGKPTIQIEEEGGGTDGTLTPASDGSDNVANAVIAGASLQPASLGTAGSGVDISGLLQVTNRILRRPGMQSELVKALMEDEEVQRILLREAGDLDDYLDAAGALPMKSLLPPAAQAAATDRADGPDLATHVVSALADMLEGAGCAMGRLAHWLRTRLPFLPGLPAPPDACDDGEAADRGGTRAGRILRGVLTVGVAVVLLMVLRRPGLSFLRRTRPL